ncbi:MAG TPA: hypothetical protein VFU22_02615 [Roseiflexaceae bacterium]|nr:hypothetical protein [Roseiflexaceae bacterium]
MDGAPLNLCLLADEEAGRAVTVKFTHTPAGDRLIEQDASGEAILVEHRGHIELRPTERP